MFKESKSNYNFDLEPYCENCPNFEIEDICKTYTSNTYGQKTTYFHIITCAHMATCDNIYKHILAKEKEKENEKTS